MGTTQNVLGMESKMTSWFWIISISIIVLGASAAAGIYLAKRRIEKGLDVYED